MARRPAVPPLDIVCLCHLRWDFVLQRPQQLMTRLARGRRVLFVEQPVEGDGEARLETADRDGVLVVTPVVPARTADGDAPREAARLLAPLVAELGLSRYVLWCYHPVMAAIGARLDPALVVYDCMDKVGSFADARPDEERLEAELLRRADLVFAGGPSLGEELRGRHPHVHVFPSSVDRRHFGAARAEVVEPSDQAALPHPRIGFFGVIEERVDLGLIAAVAAARPAWQLVLVGPVVRLDPADLPRAANIHWLGHRAHELLPGYLGGWDAAIMPFARNRSTAFISPTKTLEYLAGGRRVVSTSVRDVVSPYGRAGLVEIADEPSSFVVALERVLAADQGPWLRRVDELLERTSWDSTVDRMLSLVHDRSAALTVDETAA